MIEVERFLGKYYPAANDARKDDVRRFLNNINQLAGATPLEIALINQEILCKAFYLQKVSSISRPHYQKIKEYLINLFDFLGVQSTVPSRAEVISSQDMICYFRGIDNLLSFIDKVGTTCLVDYNPTQDLIRVKAICVLGWLGFTPEEIAEMKVSDLKPIDTIGYKLSNKYGTYEIYGHPYSSLFYLSDLVQYKGLPSGRKIALSEDSEYLMKPLEAACCEKLDSGQIIQIIKRFNACIPINLMQTSIVFRNLHKNALFIEIYNDKSDQPLLSKIAAIMRCSLNYAQSYKEQYSMFVTAIENNMI